MFTCICKYLYPETLTQIFQFKAAAENILQPILVSPIMVKFVSSDYYLPAKIKKCGSGTVVYRKCRYNELFVLILRLCNCREISELHWYIFGVSNSKK